MDNQKFPGLNIETIVEAIKEYEYVGFCRECGEETFGVEPDARNYECEVCGAFEVFGSEEILFMIST